MLSILNEIVSLITSGISQFASGLSKLFKLPTDPTNTLSGWYLVSTKVYDEYTTDYVYSWFGFIERTYTKTALVGNYWNGGYHLSLLGIVIITFCGLALAIGLCRWVMNFLTSLGAKK